LFKRNPVSSTEISPVYMRTYMILRNVLYFAIILIIVIAASAVSSSVWAGKEELQQENIIVSVSKGMTVAEFGQKHDLNRKVLKKVIK